MKSVIIAALVITGLFAGSASSAEDPRWEGSQKKESPAAAKPAGPAEADAAMSPLDIERQQKMMKILKQPPVPLKSPDKVLRVLFLPFVDHDNVLHNYKYAFVKVEEGKWVIGDYLMEPAKLDRRVLRPIDAAGAPSAAAPANKKAQDNKPAQKPQVD